MDGVKAKENHSATALYAYALWITFGDLVRQADGSNKKPEAPGGESGLKAMYKPPAYERGGF